ncbi:hypothetical protein [Corynebacterium durum]|jgi:hypothetical protein|uniref:hypothetical protein n=1 Tax=Corynebacterium durum TaxID=61592 RepID=UPI0012DFD800|nr:hypothetical protein [Corynebacterium durum]
MLASGSQRPHQTPQHSCRVGCGASLSSLSFACFPHANQHHNEQRYRNNDDDGINSEGQAGVLGGETDQLRSRKVRGAAGDTESSRERGAWKSRRSNAS